MSLRSLFIIILKTIGLFLIPQILSITLVLIVSIADFKDISNVSVIDSGIGIAASGFLETLMVIIVFGCSIYLFVFKTEWLVDKLKLEKNFQEKNVSFNMHRSSILSIVIIVIGGLLIVNNIPVFVEQVFSYIHGKQIERNSLGTYKPLDLRYVILYAVKILVGLLLVGNQKAIVNFIEFKRRYKKS